MPWLTNRKTGTVFNTDWVNVKKVDYNTFSKAIAKAKESRPVEDRWRVTAYEADHYEETGCKCYMTPDGSTVAITSSGDIISLCTTKDAVRGTGTILLEFAIAHGGTKLDSYDGNHSFYTKNGFEPVSWTPFNKEFADGWKESGQSEEHVIFYKYVGKGNVTPKYVDKATGLKNFYQDGRKFEGEDGYDKAEQYRNNHLK